MYGRSKRGGKTYLSEEDIVRVEKLTIKHLSNKETITNRELRAISAISYDQAIYFFGKMLRQRILRRRGTTAGTYYVLK
jgi:predicted HTH transcriptional regulator